MGGRQSTHLPACWERDQTMNTRVRVPIRVKPAHGPEPASPAGAPEVAEAMPPLMEREALPTVSERPETRRAPSTTSEPEPEDAGGESLEVWRDRAQRLQAEMENFRRRHQRLAAERVAADRERLLRAFLGVADDLERALNAEGADAESLWQGVDLTYQAMNKLLEQEGATPIQARGQPFDPTRHEAVGTVPHRQAGVEPDTVVRVLQPGYQLEDRLLRPARVIVAT
jgi:molecular chaperone GrpE